MASEEIRNQAEEAAKPPVGDSRPEEGVRGNREVPPTEAAVPSLEERLAAAEAARDEHLDRLQRLAADFENYRKRAARDEQALAQRAGERIVKELLPVLDDLERALEAGREHEEARVIEGVELVQRSLARILEREGVAEIETNGRFDPHVHEALLAQPSDEEEGTVIQVLQKGYRLGDRVVRPARVVVAGPPVHEA
jgi:molecular chaperone GrpE